MSTAAAHYDKFREQIVAEGRVFTFTDGGELLAYQARTARRWRVGLETLGSDWCGRVIALVPHQPVQNGEPSMAKKPNYDFEKRRKEQDRKAKKDAKRTDRQQRRDDRRAEEDAAEQTPEQLPEQTQEQ